MRYRLGPLSVAEWAQTDAGWWRELTEAVANWRSGQQSAKTTAAAIRAETADRRRE